MQGAISPEVVAQFQQHINQLVEKLLYASVPYIAGANVESVVQFADQSLYDRTHVKVIEGLVGALRYVHETEGILAVALFYQYDPSGGQMRSRQPPPANLYQLALNSGLYVLVTKSCNGQLCAELRVKPNVSKCVSNVCRREITFIDEQVDSFVKRCNERFSYGLSSKVGTELGNGCDDDDFFDTGHEWRIQEEQGQDIGGDRGLLLLVKLKQGKPFQILEVTTASEAPETFQEWAQRNRVQGTGVYPTESLDNLDQTWALLDHAADFTTATLGGSAKSLRLQDGRSVVINGGIKILVNTPDIEIIPPPEKFVNEFRQRETPTIGSRIEDEDEDYIRFGVNNSIAGPRYMYLYPDGYLSITAREISRSSITYSVLTRNKTYADAVRDENHRELKVTDADGYQEVVRQVDSLPAYVSGPFIALDKGDHVSERAKYTTKSGYPEVLKRFKSAYDFKKAVVRDPFDASGISRPGSSQYVQELIDDDAGTYQATAEVVKCSTGSTANWECYEIRVRTDDGETEAVHFSDRVSFPAKTSDAVKRRMLDNLKKKSLLATRYVETSLSPPSGQQQRYIFKVGPFSKETAAWQLAQGLQYDYPNVQLIDLGLGPIDGVFAVVFAIYDWGEAAFKVGKAIAPHIKQGAKRGEGGFGDSLRGILRRFKGRVRKEWLKKSQGLSDEEAGKLFVDMIFAASKKKGFTDPKTALFELNELSVNQLKQLPTDLILELNLLRLLKPTAMQSLRAVGYVTAQDVFDYNARRVKNASETLFGLPPSLIRLGKRSFKEQAEAGKITIDLDTPVTSDDVEELVDRARSAAGIIDVSDEETALVAGNINVYLTEEERDILRKTEPIGIEPVTTILIASAVVVITASAIGAVGVAAGTTGAAVAPEVMAGWAKGSGGFGDSFRRSKRKILRGVKKKYLKWVKRKDDVEIEELLAAEIIEKAQKTDPQEAVNIIQTMTNDDLASLPVKALDALVVSNTLTSLQVGFLLTREPPLVTKASLKNTVYNPSFVLNLKNLSKRQLLDIPTQTLLVFMRQCVFTVTQVVFLIVAHGEDPSVGVSQKQLRGFCYGQRKRRRQINKLLKREDLENYFNEKIPTDDAAIDIPGRTSTSFIGQDIEDAYIGQMMEALAPIGASRPLVQINPQPLLDIFDGKARQKIVPPTTTTVLSGTRPPVAPPWGSWREPVRRFVPPADRVDEIHSLVSLHPNVLQYLLDFGTLPGEYSAWRGAAQVFISVDGAKIALLRAYIFVMSQEGVASAVITPNSDRLEFQCSKASFQPTPRTGDDFFQRRDGVRLGNIRATTNQNFPLEALLIVSRSMLGVLCNRGPFYPFFVDVRDNDRRRNLANRSQRNDSNRLRRFLQKRGFKSLKKSSVFRKAIASNARTSKTSSETLWDSMNLGPLTGDVVMEDSESWKGVDPAPLNGVYKIASTIGDMEEESGDYTRQSIVPAILSGRIGGKLKSVFKNVAAFTIAGVPGVIVHNVLKKRKKEKKLEKAKDERNALALDKADTELTRSRKEAAESRAAIEALQEDMQDEQALVSESIAAVFNGAEQYPRPMRRPITPYRARNILRRGHFRGRRLSARQRRYFNWVSRGRRRFIGENFSHEDNEYDEVEISPVRAITPLYIAFHADDVLGSQVSDIQSVTVSYRNNQVVRTALSEERESDPLVFRWASSDGSHTLLTVGQAMDFVNQASHTFTAEVLNFWKLVIYTGGSFTDEERQKSFERPGEVIAISVPDLSRWLETLEQGERRKMLPLEMPPFFANKVPWKVDGDQDIFVSNREDSVNVYTGGTHKLFTATARFFMPSGMYRASLEFEQLALTTNNGLLEIGEILFIGGGGGNNDLWESRVKKGEFVPIQTTQGRIDAIRQLYSDLVDAIRENKDSRRSAGIESKEFAVPAMPSTIDRFTFPNQIHAFKVALNRVRNDTARI